LKPWEPAWRRNRRRQGRPADRQRVRPVPAV